MKKDICAIYPELEKAAHCRMYSTLCNILFQVDADDYETIKNVWSKLKKIRWNVIKNPKARKKNRIGALVSFAGYRIMRKIYNLTQWRARM